MKKNKDCMMINHKKLIYFFVILSAFLIFAGALMPSESFAQSSGEIVFVVRSKINSDGAMLREVISPASPADVNFARAEFLSDRTSEITEEKTPDGKVRLTQNFRDLEDCIGVLMVQKDLYFAERFQVRQSIPQYFDEKVMASVKARFEFEIPSGVVKVQKDKKTQPRQFGVSTVNEFKLDRPGNMDVFYQYNNVVLISLVVLIVVLLFALAKIWRAYSFLLVPVLAVVISFIFAGIVIYVIGESPVSAMGAIFAGVFSSQTNVFNMLLAATPLIFTGLGVAFAFNCGLFNIGGEGQVMVGGFFAAWAGYALSLPPLLHIVVCFIVAGIAAGLYSVIAGWMRAKFHVHEVISTIMLNYIAYSTLGFLVLQPYFKENGPNPQTNEIASSAFLPTFIPRHDLNYGFVIALLTAIVIWFILYRTSFGFNIRSVGFNEKAAEYSGVNISRSIMMTMFISGLLCGFGGTERVIGSLHKFNSTGFVGYGIDGIAVALLASNNPLAIIISALLFGFLKSGGAYMNREIGVPVELVVIVQAVIIFFIAADKIVRNMLKIRE